jgi:tetratricopeptide (TPR) repeat protein
MSMNNLADLWGNQGKYEQAEGMHRRALGLRETVLGKKHPYTLSSMADLAHIWKSQGRDQEAIALMGRAKRLQEKVLGIHHPHTMKSSKALQRWLATDVDDSTRH